MLDGLLDLACHLESRSEEIEKVGDAALPILVKLIKLLLNLLVQFSAAGINEKNIQPTTGSPVLVGEALVDTILPGSGLPLGDLVPVLPEISLRLIPPIRRVHRMCLSKIGSLEVGNQ